MSTRIVYIVARNGEMQGTISLHDGNVLIFIPNYTEIKVEPPVGIDRDQFVYTLEVPEEQVHQSPGEPWRLWAGPKGEWGYRGDTIRAVLRPKPWTSLADAPQGLSPDGE
jgi:hypothetical protein